MRWEGLSESIRVPPTQGRWAEGVGVRTGTR